MDYKSILGKLVNELSLYESVYDYIRLVDPVRKKTSYYLKSETDTTETIRDSCYEFWQKDTACYNCISARALRHGGTFVKVEFVNDCVYMITAIPVNVGEDKLVIELVKNITGSGILDLSETAFIDMQKIISKRNRAIMQEAVTRVFNESFIYERLPYDIVRGREGKIPLLLVYASLHNIQAINEQHGYDAGDQVIRQCASVFKKSCKDPSDWVARYRGAEFILLLNGVEQERAFQVCRRLSIKLGKTRFEYRRKPIVVRTSFGCCVPEASVSIEELITMASKNIYEDAIRAADASTTYASMLDKYLLTARESEVALLLLGGYSNTEIASRLFVGIPTVKKHLSAIYDKAKVRSRAEFISSYKSG